MTGKVFLDTNVWLYALIKSDSVKYAQATRLIEHEANIHSNVQVANEIAINLMRKSGKDNRYIQAFLGDFVASYPVATLTPEELLTAAGLRLDYRLSYWDSLIVAAALQAGCDTLYSEDMQDGLRVDGCLRIVNPFRQDTP